MDVTTDALAKRWQAWATQAAATPFQGIRWLQAWYASIGRALGDPLLVAVFDRRKGGLAALLPLIRRSGSLRTIEFADDGVSDNNAPVLGPASPTDAATARLFFSALRRALPVADVIRFTKMPVAVESRINPLTLLPGAQKSSLNSNIVAIEGRWDDYLASLKGSLRRQMDRNWRALATHAGVEFRRIRESKEAATILTALERQQSARLKSGALPYRLDESEFAEFYRSVTVGGVADGSVVLTGLMCGAEVVATLLGVARGASFIMLRSSIGAEKWQRCSPGRLLIVRTMQALHEAGYRYFDLSIGEYDYKRRLGAQGRPLFDLSVALSLRGLPVAAYDRAKHWSRQHSLVHSLARRVVRSAGSLKAQSSKTDPA
ncbi:MAG: GNAT family N-acetyltransferase [Methylobacteriaceae bacterium]|nr:GNAT family N-acetyltransferase [Methylobacteriaceae bacterium]